MGYTTEQALAEVSVLKRLFDLLPEVPLQDEWERLVAHYHVSGKNAHDARLVAAMLVNGVNSIVTFNVQDFERYKEIRVFNAAKAA